jgi:hypothetical protein
MPASLPATQAPANTEISEQITHQRPAPMPMLDASGVPPRCDGSIVLAPIPTPSRLNTN